MTNFAAEKLLALLKMLEYIVEVKDFAAETLMLLKMLE